MRLNSHVSASFTIALGLMLFPVGCATNSNVERGRDGTIAYMVDIEASGPGARVEVNGDYLGVTPTKIKIFGDEDGTFHNFGSSDFVIDVFPVKTNQFRQRRVFRTGG